MPVEHRDDPAWGDVWTWTTIDRRTKLVPSWYVGDRSSASAIVLVDDLRSRLAGRVHAGVGEPDCYANCVSSSKPDKRRARTTGESGVASH